MAKQSKSSGHTGKVKIRVIEFEVEGSDDTMQESLKSITAALNKGMTAAQPNRVRYIPAPNQQEEELEEQELEDLEEEGQPQAATRKPSTPKKPPTTKLLEISFTDTTPTLKDFIADKSPKSVLQKALVIAYWYKHYKQIPEITADHLFTAYRHLQWTVPRDPGQAIRDLRHKRRTQLTAGSTPGASTINHIGENIVMQMGRGE